MFEKNIPSDIPELCGPGNIERGLTLRLEEILPNPDIKTQVKTGNKCQHNPTYPKQYVSRETSKQLPWLIQKIKRNVSKHYFDARKWLKDIGETRSERREAIILVGEAIATYTDLESLEVKYPNYKRGTFEHVSIKFLASVTGLGLRRVMRAIEHFVAAGYLAVTRQGIMRSDGSFRALVSIRKVSIKFFTHLGVSFKALKKQIDKRIGEKLTKTSEEHSRREGEKLLNSYKPSLKYIPQGSARNITELISGLKSLLK